MTDQPQVPDYEYVATTSSTGYTHVCCATCGHVLYCSEAEPWQPQTEYGWCWHGCCHGSEPEAVGTSLPGPTDWHNCILFQALHRLHNDGGDAHGE